MADHVVRIWREPDEGLWEVCEGSGYFVYSKVMCWVALDRAIKLSEVYGYEGNRALWKAEKNEIYKEVMEKGYNREIGAFTQRFNSEDLDASVLLLPVVGFIAGDDPKMLSTIDSIEKTLVDKNGLMRRYLSSDGFPGVEGAFLLASFWLVDAYVYAGKRDKAVKLFERLLSYKNHVGLYSEEIDPKTKAFLGNFPQAYTHIGLINTALLLDREEGYLFQRLRNIFNIFKKLFTEEK